MGYWHLTAAQIRIVKQFTTRRVVYDLGAGDLTLSARLLELKAAGVIAVDEKAPAVRDLDSKIRFIKSSYNKFTKAPRTAFVSWPPGVGAEGLVDIVGRARTVLYLGHNFDGNICGTQELWAHLRTRKVIAHEPACKNTLIVYGAVGREREPLPEEDAATDYRKIRLFHTAYPGVWDNMNLELGRL